MDLFGIFLAIGGSSYPQTPLAYGPAHVQETGAINRLHFRRRFLVRVSCISGTGFVWYQIPVASRILFYSRLEYFQARNSGQMFGRDVRELFERDVRASFVRKLGVHVTEMMSYDWWTIITYVLVCFLFVI